jgi:hypothetical protein
VIVAAGDVGFKYRLREASGTPEKSRGRISEAYFEEKSDLVSKSSDGRLGAVKLEKARAADLMAWSEAVRFDLMEERGLVERDSLGVDVESRVGTGSSGMGVNSRGWSKHSMVGGEESFSFLSMRRRKLAGVTGDLNEGDVESSSALREGVVE